jgi:hypothetical protein
MIGKNHAGEEKCLLKFGFIKTSGTSLFSAIRSQKQEANSEQSKNPISY